MRRFSPWWALSVPLLCLLGVLVYYADVADITPYAANHAPAAVEESPVSDPLPLSLRTVDRYETQNVEPSATNKEKKILDAGGSEKPDIAIESGLQTQFIPPEGETPEKRLPKALIAGFAKCGTGALQKAICMHPYVVCQLKGEVNFYNKFFDKGYSWYRSMMNPSYSNQVTLEKTPFYVLSSFAAEEIKKKLPDTRLVFIVRDPVVSVQSHYAHYLAGVARGKRRLWKDFKDYYDNNQDVINASAYAFHLRKWYATFDADQLLVIDQAEFGSSPVPVMRRMEKFLNIPPMFTEANFPRLNPTSSFYCYREFNNRTTCLNPENKEREHEEYSAGDQKRMKDYFRPYNAELKVLTGQDFQWT